MKNPAQLFRALADDTRVRMVALIRRHGELCVCDLENVLEIGQSKASRHLRYLLNAGLLADRRAAVWIYYRLADTLSPAQTAVLQSIDSLIDNSEMRDLDAKLAAWRERKACALKSDRVALENLSDGAAA